MAEKQKTINRPSSQMSNFRMLLLFVFVTIAAVIVFIILQPLIFTELTIIRQTSLSAELYTVAEALDDPVRIGDESLVLMGDMPVHLTVHNWGLMSTTHMLCISSNQASDVNYVSHSRIFVNGTRIWNSSMMPTLDDGLFLDNTSPKLDMCVSGNLESGLHLLEFHLRDSMWGEPIATQQWAIEIE